MHPVTNSGCNGYFLAATCKRSPKGLAPWERKKNKVKGFNGQLVANQVLRKRPGPTRNGSVGRRLEIRFGPRRLRSQPR